MRNVLIVDDDTIVRITLHSLVNWEELGYHIVGDAIHGEQALQYMKEYDVDLVITDMKMPVMDGIGLLTALSRQVTVPKALVLSGYDDFTLVRHAFRLGAFDYLLKADLNEELLTAMLLRLNQEGWKVTTDGMDNRVLDKDYEAADNSDPGQVLVDIAMGRRGIKDSIFQREYVVVQFEIEDFHKHLGRFDGNVEEQLIKPVLEFANQIPRVVTRCVLGSISPSRYVMLYHVNYGDSQFREQVVSACKQLCKVWNNYMNLPVSAGISNLGTCPLEFTQRFEEAGSQLRLRYLKGKAQICYPWEEGVVSCQQVQEAGESYEKLIQGLMVSDELAVNAEKQKLFDKFYVDGLEAAQSNCLWLICCLAWKMQESHDDINALFADEVNYYQKVKRLNEVRNLELWMNNYFRWIMDYMENHQDRKQADMMIRAKRFIMDNYSNPELMLGSVAGYIGLNEKYFSSRFTKAEGTTFSNYLTEVRIRKAKELMDKTDLKMYEISQQVGYNNVEHFNRVFKKMYRISPGTYKKGDPTNI